ncbi:MAG: hypothetical protein KBT20_06160 [Bacteroidales bacterium]|nr:hypothetical protein [Candidatus Liminaster caballi]
MINKFKLINHPVSYTSNEKIGVIHAVGAEQSAVKQMKEALSLMDSSKMLFPYRINAEDNNLEDFNRGLYVYVTNILTKEVYLAKAICDDKVLASDMAKFIVSIEIDLKRLLAHNIRCLAVNSPELCSKLLTSIYVPRQNDDICIEHDYSTQTALGVVPASSIALENSNEFLLVSKLVLGDEASEDNLIENFISLCNAIYNKDGDPEKLKMAEKIVEKLLKNMCSTSEAKMVNFVRERSEDRMFFKNFVYECLDPEQLATKAQVTIYVKKKMKDEAVSKNQGHYRFFTEKGGVHKPLKFGRELSNVYMLMYLIDHVKQPNRKQPINLKVNIEEFKRLYYDLFNGIRDAKDINHIVKEYFHRQDKSGNFRSGRKSEYLDAIRKTMQEQFEEYNESYLPYIMTGSTHLHVPIDKIVFEDDIKEALLGYNFI